MCYLHRLAVPRVAWDRTDRPPEDESIRSVRDVAFQPDRFEGEGCCLLSSMVLVIPDTAPTTLVPTFPERKPSTRLHSITHWRRSIKVDYVEICYIRGYTDRINYQSGWHWHVFRVTLRRPTVISYSYNRDKSMSNENKNWSAYYKCMYVGQ